MTRYLFLAFVLSAIAALVLFAVQQRREECKVRWQASSVRVVDGKVTKPYITSNCDPEGRQQSERR